MMQAERRKTVVYNDVDNEEFVNNTFALPLFLPKASARFIG